MHPWMVAAAVAERQHLYVGRWQLRWLGLSDKAVQQRVLRHGWTRPSPGLLRLPGPATTTGRLVAAVLPYASPTEATRRATELHRAGLSPDRALVRAAFGARAVICGPSAAHVLGLLAPEPPHVWIRLSGHANLEPRPGVRLVHRDLPGQGAGGSTGVGGPGWAWIGILPVTTVAPTLVDIAGAALPERQRMRMLYDVIVTADATRRGTVEQLQSAVEDQGRFVGRPLLLRVLADLRGDLSHSATERRARGIAAEVAARHNVSLHPRPYPIRHKGRIVAEADLAVIELRYDVEIDGPQHRLPRQRRKDDARDRRAAEAGWVVDRFDVDLVDHDPLAFAAAVDATIRNLLQRGSAADVVPHRTGSAEERREPVAGR